MPASPHTSRATLTVLLLALIGGMAASGCSVRRMAVDLLAGAMVGEGGAFVSDDDPELVREALPFGLKTFESLLEVSPGHQGLLLAATRGYAALAYLLGDQADRLEAQDLGRARELRRRAHRLYRRARDYGLAALEARYPGFRERLRVDQEATLAVTTVTDAALLYWTGAAWAGALGADKGDLGLIGELPRAAAMVRRVLALDERFDGAAAHEFLVAYEGGRPGGSAAAAREHYRRALEISAGQRASVHLTLAESVVVREQRLDEFHALLGRALQVDPDRVPAFRLANVITRRRALWLRTRIADLFLDAEPAEGKQ